MSEKMLVMGREVKREVLDFGAGYGAPHTMAMRALGMSVTAHDIGRNYQDGVHCPMALEEDYDVVMASNVVNTHATPNALVLTVAQMAMATRGDGVCVCNYPDNPRKGPWSVAQMQEWLRGYFYDVELKKYNGTAVFFCRCPNVAAAEGAIEFRTFSQAELDTCTIRPAGAVGSKALVPRVVIAMLGAEGGAL